MNETDLLHELAPEAERLLERHLSTSKEWFPHQLVPWDRAAKSDPRHPWDIAAHPMDEAVRQALFLNLLTEDNLPYYTSKIDNDVRHRPPVGCLEPPVDGRGGPPLDRHPRLPHPVAARSTRSPWSGPGCSR